MLPVGDEEEEPLSSLGVKLMVMCYEQFLIPVSSTLLQMLSVYVLGVTSKTNYLGKGATEETHKLFIEIVSNND